MNERAPNPTPDDWSIEPPIPADVPSVMVFGGAFDPPHIGHVAPPIAARDAMGVGWLLYVPAARPPLKGADPAASADDRIEMLRRALHGHDSVSVTDVELARGGVSYMLDTLHALRDRLPAQISLRLLIGADQAASLHRWREPRRIIALAEPVVMLREDGDSADRLIARMAPHWSEAELARWQQWIAPVPPRPACSTWVREMLGAAGPDAPALAHIVPPRVLEYIRARGLYGRRAAR